MQTPVRQSVPTDCGHTYCITVVQFANMAIAEFVNEVAGVLIYKETCMGLYIHKTALDTVPYISIVEQINIRFGFDQGFDK